MGFHRHLFLWANKYGFQYHKIYFLMLQRQRLGERERERVLLNLCGCSPEKIIALSAVSTWSLMLQIFSSLHKKFPNYSSGKCSHWIDKRSSWIAMNLKFWRFHFAGGGREQNPIEFSYHKTQFPWQFLIHYLFDINHVRFSRGDVSFSFPFSVRRQLQLLVLFLLPPLVFFTLESRPPRFIIPTEASNASYSVACDVTERNRCRILPKGISQHYA
jgi:hypothetical protein